MQENEFRSLETRLEQLRRKYDQYFLGMENREPGFDRELLERDLRKTKLFNALNGALRFRFKQFMARFRTLAERWDRISRQIEDGTYNRGATTQRERLAARQAEVAIRMAEGLDPSTGRPADGSAPDTSAMTGDHRRIHNTSNAAQAYLAKLMHGDKAPAASAPASGPPPLSPTRKPGVESLYQAYVAAKNERGEDTTKITMRRFARSVEKQEKLAREKLGADVELRVKVTDKKVTLVAARKKQTT